MVTGHVHTGLLQPLMQDGRILVRVSGYGEELGRLELKVDTVKKAPVGYTWKHVPVDSSSLAPAGTGTSLACTIWCISRLSTLTRMDLLC